MKLKSSMLLSLNFIIIIFFKSVDKFIFLYVFFNFKKPFAPQNS